MPAALLRSAARSGLLGLGFVLLLGCGARTGLHQSGDDGGRDAAPSVTESCDGRDDDGDGRVDEGLPSMMCGSGACAREVASCVEGVPATCPPIVPEAEFCNRRDDDCDGRIDEGLGFGPIGEPIVVRDVDDERTGDCSDCARVIGARLATFGDELHAIWHLNLFGFIDVPNTFARRLADDGVPLEPSRPLFDALTLRADFAASHDGHTMASFCQRLEDRRDYPRAQLLDRYGRPVNEVLQRVEHEGEACLAGPRALWTGERHLFFRQRSRGPLIVEAADRDGRTVTSTELPWNSSWNASMSIGFDGQRATLLTYDELGEPRPRIVEVDARGEVVLDQLLEWPAGYADWNPTRAALGAPAGPIWAATEDQEGRGRLALFRFDRETEASSSIVESELTVGGSVRLLRRRPEQLLAVFGTDGQLEVLDIDQRGEILGHWVFGEARTDRFESVDVHAHRGSVFVSYVRRIDRTRTTVEVLELGCTP